MMFQYEFLNQSHCSDEKQFKDIINDLVADGWELFNVLSMDSDIVACLRKKATCTARCKQLWRRLVRAKVSNS